MPALGGIARLAFGRPVAARNWLQASNPSERWKWDFMFQDLPPVKGAVDPSAVPLPPGAIPATGACGPKRGERIVFLGWDLAAVLEDVPRVGQDRER